MSWDVLLLAVPEEIRSANDLPNDFASVLGPCPHVLATLTHEVPGIDLSDPTWGILNGGDFSIEFNIGSKDPVDSIMLHVRGGDAAVAPIRRLAAATGWRALDFSTSEFIDFSGAVPTGFTEWRAFADRAIATAEQAGATIVRNPNIRGVHADALLLSPKTRKRPWRRFWSR